MKRRFSVKVGAMAATAAALLVGAVGTAAHADTYSSGAGDNFIAGSIVPGTPTGLTVTKYMTAKGDTGSDPTGSAQDAIPGATPAANVVFSLCEVTATDGNPGNMQLPDTNITVGTTCFYGNTNGSGQITQWYDTQAHAQAGGATGATSLPAAVAASPQYYILHEVVAPSGVTPAQDSLFGIPYRATNTLTAGGTQTGYLYNPSVYPKNASTSTLTKSVEDANGSHVAQVGDTLNYTLAQQVTNSGKVNAGDSTLDTAEIGTVPTANGYTTGGIPAGTAAASATADGTAQLRVTDQLSTALQLKGTPTVGYTCGSVQGTVPAADYVTNYSLGTTTPSTLPTSSPKVLVGNGTGALFPNNPGAGTTYVTFDFFTAAGVTDFQTGGTIQKACGTNTISINIGFSALVTGAGDSTGGSAGMLTNVASSDVWDGTKNSGPNTGTGDIFTGGFQFLKTTSDKKTVLPGATFGLVNPTDQGMFLYSDGKYYADGATVPAGVVKLTATSNANGLVTFIGLPIMTAATAPATGYVGVPSGTAVWDVTEISAPSGYATPSVVFGGGTAAKAAVTFNGIAGMDSAAIQAAFPNGVVPDTTPAGSTAGTMLLTAFGNNYGFASTVKNPTGQMVNVGLINFTPSEAPIGLPLTGGRGIILFLAAGVLIMAAALIVRSRRQRKATRA